MAPEKSPAFQFYPKDFLTDGRVAAMSLEECGAYIKLLCLCWTETALPIEPKRLAQMIGCTPSAFARVWPAIRPCFSEGDGVLRHGRLDKERHKKASFNAKQKEKAERRWHPSGNATALPVQCQTDALQSPVSDLQSPKPSLERAVIQPLPKPTAIYDAADGERAGRLVDRYGELFLKHRAGARYRQRPNLDWHDALTLVPVWDDARLDKLAEIILTTDDEWIAQTDRGFKIFALKATWADDRLRAWEQKHQVSA